MGLTDLIRLLRDTRLLDNRLTCRQVVEAFARDHGDPSAHVGFEGFLVSLKALGLKSSLGGPASPRPASPRTASPSPLPHRKSFSGVAGAAPQVAEVPLQEDPELVAVARTEILPNYRGQGDLLPVMGMYQLEFLVSILPERKGVEGQREKGGGRAARGRVVSGGRVRFQL
jgi:hypothetical protein